MKVSPLNVNDKNENKKLSCFTATSLVIANIIGTGIFVSLGFQAMSISSQFCLLFAWFIGGIIALCGALFSPCYFPWKNHTSDGVGLHPMNCSRLKQGVLGQSVRVIVFSVSMFGNIKGVNP